MPKLCPVCGTSYPDALVFCPADATALRAADVQGDLVGSVVADRYLVTDVLGEGGMGKVYLARHVRLPQQAAIKVLRKEMLRDAAAIARFNREASNASRIDHDRVARVYDFGETDDGVVYLAMEYIHGRTLKAIIADGGPLAPERAAGLVRQISEALDAAHRLGIVHRDLKPENVMVIEDADGTERVKVVDFGIAKAFGADEGGQGLTKTGFVIGTPEFMSPEQLLGTALDARSDIYALGIVAYQCLTGELPFDSEAPDRGLSARLTMPARTLQTVRPAIGWAPEVQAAFDAALARDADDRPATAGAFAKNLAAAIDRWQNGARDTNTSAPHVAAAPVTSAPRPAPPAPTPSAPTPAAAASSRGISSGAIMAGVVVLVLVLAGGGYALMNRGEPAADTTTPAVVAPNVPPAVVPNARPAPDTHPVATADSVPTAAPSTTAPATNSTTTPTSTPTSTPASSPPATRPVERREAIAAATGASPVVAKHTLDSISNAMDPDHADESVARAAIPVLRALLPRLGSANDSTFAEIRMAEAFLLLGDQQRACGAYRRAKAAAPTPARREDVQRFITATCP